MLTVTDGEWDKAGRRLALKLGFDREVTQVLDDMLSQGVDHHLVIRQGDYTAQLEQFCDFAGVEKIKI